MTKEETRINQNSSVSSAEDKIMRRSRSLSELPGHLRVPVIKRKDTERTRARLEAGLAGVVELNVLRARQQQMFESTMVANEEIAQNKNNKRMRRQESLKRLRENRQYGCNKNRNNEELDNSLDTSSEYTGWGSTNSLAQTERLHVHRDRNSKTFCPTGPYYQSHKSDSRRRSYNGKETNEKDHFPFSTPPTQSDHVIPGFNTPVSYSFREAKAYSRPYSEQFTPVSTSFKSSVNNAPENGDEKCNVVDSRAYLKPGINYNRMIFTNTDMGNPNNSQADFRKSPCSLENPSLIFTEKPKRQQSFGEQIKAEANLKKLSSQILTPETTHSRASLYLTQSNADYDSISEHTSIKNTSYSEMSPTRRTKTISWEDLLNNIGVTNKHKNESLEEIKADTPQNTGNISSDSGRCINKKVDETTQQTKIESIPKVGRSMSFSFGSPTLPLTKLLSNKQMMQAMFPVPDSRPKPIDNSKTSDENHKSIDENVVMRPKPASKGQCHLRRASFQCDAVLTKSRKIVNPIQDMNIKDIQAPGPLHAVTLQYHGLKSEKTNGNNSINDQRIGSNVATDNENEDQTVAQQITYLQQQKPSTIGLINDSELQIEIRQASKQSLRAKDRFLKCRSLPLSFVAEEDESEKNPAIDSMTITDEEFSTEFQSSDQCTNKTLQTDSKEGCINIKACEDDSRLSEKDIIKWAEVVSNELSFTDTSALLRFKRKEEKIPIKSTQTSIGELEILPSQNSFSETDFVTNEFPQPTYSSNKDLKTENNFSRKICQTKDFLNTFDIKPQIGSEKSIEIPNSKNEKIHTDPSDQNADSQMPTLNFNEKENVISRPLNSTKHFVDTSLVSDDGYSTCDSLSPLRKINKENGRYLSINSVSTRSSFSDVSFMSDKSCGLNGNEPVAVHNKNTQISDASNSLDYNNTRNTHISNHGNEMSNTICLSPKIPNESHSFGSDKINSKNKDCRIMKTQNTQEVLKGKTSDLNAVRNMEYFNETNKATIDVGNVIKLPKHAAPKKEKLNIEQPKNNFKETEISFSKGENQIKKDLNKDENYLPYKGKIFKQTSV